MLLQFSIAAIALAGRGLAASSLTARDDSNCSAYQLIIARGTGEPGQYGAIVGDPLVKAVLALEPEVTAYALDYPASLACNSEALGAANLMDYLNSSIASCPDQKYAMVGYSQGADVIHHVGLQLPESQYDYIIALVMFGDPNNRGVGQYDPAYGQTSNVTSAALPSALANKLRENCNTGDPVCTNNGSTYLAHIEYSAGNNTFISGSADYIHDQIYLNGGYGPDDSHAAAPGSQTNANLEAVQQLGLLLGAGNVTACTPAGSSSATTSGTAVATSSSGTASSPATTSTAVSTTGSGSTSGSSTSSGATTSQTAKSAGVRNVKGGTIACALISLWIAIALTGLAL